MLNLPVYLDHAATTFPEEAVISAMTTCMRAQPCNASSAYSAAGDARRIHRFARRRIAEMLGCPSEDIFFTSGGTEANNWAIRAFAGEHVVLSAIEHHSVLEASRAAGCRITTVLPDRTGLISPDAIAAAITPETRLIALQWANNETGVIQPVREVHALAKAKRIHLHVDAVQAFGHIPVDASFCDSMALSAHKLYGPRGAGALYVRSGAPLPPLLVGGGQESGMRAGTENTPAICGFEVAAQMADEDMQLRMNRESKLLGTFIHCLKERIPGIVWLGEERKRLPAIAALLLPGISSEQAISQMDLRGVMISGGAACASRSGQPSHVYTAMGLTQEEASRVIRVSIGRHTTIEQLDYAARMLESIIPAQAR
ncbi:MAG: cysteine desulfurase [Clostridiales bacterium]|nr:cysteine desulfurase [Clostridiales bacterium]